MSEQGDAVSRRRVLDLLCGFLRWVEPPEDSFSRLESALLRGIVRRVEALPALGEEAEEMPEEPVAGTWEEQDIWQVRLPQF